MNNQVIFDCLYNLRYMHKIVRENGIYEGAHHMSKVQYNVYLDYIVSATIQLMPMVQNTNDSIDMILHESPILLKSKVLQLIYTDICMFSDITVD